MQPKSLIVAATGTNELSKNLGQNLETQVFPILPMKFPNQELKLKIDQVGQTTILVGSFSAPVNTRIMEYLLAADAIKRQGCHQIIGVISYLAYSKQDKVFLPGEPLSAKVVATILQTSPLSELITVDLHNPSISGYFDFPVANLSAVKLLADAAKPELLPNSLVVSPDAGSIKSASRFAELLDLPLAFATKHRDLTTGQITITDLSRSIAGQNVYIYDDMIATGSTLIQLSRFLKDQGAASIHISCTHHLYLKQVQDNIDQSPIDQLTVTNTIAKPDDILSPKLKVIDCSSIIAERLTEVTQI